MAEPHEQLEALLTAELQKWAKMVDDELPEGWGFTLMVFPYHSKEVLYVSSAQRDDMAKTIKGMLKRWRKDGIG